MKKSKIIIYHLLIFALGSVGIFAYIFDRLASPESNSGLGGAIAMPAIAVVYVIGFGILCFISLAIFFITARFRRRSKK